MLQRHMLILENNDMFTDCTAGKNCDFFDKSHPSWNYVSEKRQPQGDKFPWIATDLQKLVRLSYYYLACWQSGWVRCKTEPWGSNKWALCLKADDPKPSVCPPHPFGRGTESCGAIPSEITTDGNLCSRSSPALQKSLSSRLFLQPIRHLRYIRAPSPWLCVTLVVLVPLMLLSHLFLFQKLKWFLLLGCFGSCPDSRISILLTAWPSCRPSACGL